MDLNSNKYKYSVLLSLFSRKTHQSKRPSPKNYPYYNDLIKLLKKNNLYTIQIGIEGEIDIGAHERFDNLDIDKLLELLNKEKTTFICCDNFLAHFAHFYNRYGIVLFGQSDPNLFGYKENINLYKDKKFFRFGANQYQFWEDAKNIKEAFVEPQIVVNNLFEHFLKEKPSTV